MIHEANTQLRRWRWALGALALLGCQPDFGTIETVAISSPPGSVNIERYGTYVEVPAGVAVVIRTDIDSRTRTEYEDDTRLDLLSKDREIATTYRRPSPREFVVVGLNPGETCLEVTIEGDAQDCIPVTVTEPAL